MTENIHLTGKQSHSDSQLVDSAKPTTQVEWRDLRYVHRHQRGVQAAVHPDQVAPDDEQLVGGDVLGEHHRHRRHDADQVVHEQTAFPPELVGNPASCDLGFGFGMYYYLDLCDRDRLRPCSLGRLDVAVAEVSPGLWDGHVVVHLQFSIFNLTRCCPPLILNNGGQSTMGIIRHVSVSRCLMTNAL